jgi:hypothetical protein
MGAKQGTAHLFLVTEQSTVVAGRELACVGHMLLNRDVVNPTLEVRFVGKETCSFQADGVKKGKSKVVEYTNYLVPPNLAVLQAGSFSFPFVIETPEGVPGTFQAEMKNFQAQIKYKARLLLKENRNTIAKSKAEVVVEQALDQNRFSILTPYSGNIVCCDCCHRGTCNLTVHVDKNAYMPSETVKVWVDVDNSRARRKMSSVIVMLWRVIRLISDNREVGMFKKCIFKKTVPTNIASGARLLTGQEICVDVELRNKENKLDMCATTVGKVVQCRYYVEVSTDYGRCISREIELEVPVIVIPKHIPPPLPSAPEDWNPVEMPITRISIQSSNASILDKQYD